MSRDNALFALLGLVVGFVAAYPVFEVISTRQPPPRWAATGGEATAAAGAPQAAPMTGGSGTGPQMEEVRQLRERIERNPNDAEAICRLAQMNLMVQDFQRARPLLEQCQRLVPADPDVLKALANLYFDLKEFPLARERYEQLLQAQPGDLDVQTDLGVAYRYLQQPQKALELFRKVQGQNPQHWASLYNEVVVLAFDLKDYTGARAGIARLQSLQPGNPDVARLAAEIDRQQSGGAAAQGAS
ncbi:MAG TPA: tetratricopeptide repeat protein [Thermoanaerobaculia bacterium]|nr:tetratricopeptide repeat protein [Thermoanaerobaculia bacterium]